MFVGREYYLERLDALWRKSVSSLVVISGRRRIGKSTLVETFAARTGCRFIEIEGLAPDKDMTNQKQIEKMYRNANAFAFGRNGQNPGKINVPHGKKNGKKTEKTENANK